MGGMRHFVPRQKREVQEYRCQGRSGTRRWKSRHCLADGRRPIGGGVDAGRRQHPWTRLLHTVHPPTSPRGGQSDHIARAHVGSGRRKRQPQHLSGNPRLHQRPLGDLPGLAAGQRNRKVDLRDGFLPPTRQARLGDLGLVGRFPCDVADAHLFRQVRVGGPRHLDVTIQLPRRHCPALDDRVHFGAPLHEDEPSLALHRIDAMCQKQRLEVGPDRTHVRQQVSADIAVYAAGVARNPRLGAELLDDRRKRPSRRAPVHPVTLGVVRPVGPQIGAARKGGPGTGIPRPQVGAIHVDHPSAVERALRVVRRIVPVRRDGPNVLHLGVLVAASVRSARVRAL